MAIDSKAKMLICVEGAIGVGKTTLATNLATRLRGIAIKEDFASNPFLSDFYQDPDRFAFHVQMTFLCLQERMMQIANNLSSENNLVISDFHPFKSLIFAPTILTQHDVNLIETVYKRCFSSFPPPSLVLFLTAPTEIIVNRIRERNDEFTQSIDSQHIHQIAVHYERFYDDYRETKLKVDTASLDFRNADGKDINDLILKIQGLALQ